MHVGKRIARKAGMVATVLSIAAGPAVLDVSPAGAHETTQTVGGAVGTVGAAHSGVRICELSDGPGIGRIMIIPENIDGGGTISVTDGCKTRQYAEYGGVVQYRVGWDRGGGTVWGQFQRA